MRWLVFGHLSVDAFIVLSGYCLMLQVQRNGGVLKGGWTQFYWKRARRILPTFYAAVLLCAGLGLTVLRPWDGGLWDECVPVRPFGLLMNGLVLQEFLKASKFNYVFWSVAVEWKIYFLFPLIVLIWRRWGAVWPTLAVLAVVMPVAWGLDHHRAIAVLFSFTGLFVMGVTAATLRPASGWPAGMIAGIAALLSVAALHRFGTDLIADARLDGVVGLAFAAGLVALAQSNDSWPRRLLGCPPLARLGLFSYSLYLTHAPVIELVRRPLVVRGFADQLLVWMLMAIALPLSIGVAYGFYLLFERPFATAAVRKPEVASSVPVTALDGAAAVA